MKEKKDDIIIRLQQDYLETGSSAVLEELYINILRLSFFILKYKRYNFMDYSEKDLLVRDIASNIICRLIEKQERQLLELVANDIEDILGVNF